MPTQPKTAPRGEAVLDPDRFFAPDPGQHRVARKLYGSIRDLPSVGQLGGRTGGARAGRYSGWQGHSYRHGVRAGKAYLQAIDCRNGRNKGQSRESNT